MRKEYDQQNVELFKTFLETTFFKNWRNSYRVTDCENDKADPEKEKWYIHNYGSLELDLGYACDLSCKYCYYSRYGKELYQNKPVRAKDVLENAQKLMNFLAKNNMYCHLDIFAGEPFVLNYIWDFLDVIYEGLKGVDLSKRTSWIGIPTNLSFLKKGNEKKLEKVAEYKEKFRDIQVGLSLSGSFDGPFMDEENRTQKRGAYDDHFYKNVKKYIDKLGVGLHPMIYSNNIEYWPDNFLWFTSYLNRQLYLLEVRNLEWTAEQCKHLYYFIKFVIHCLYKSADRNREKFLESVGLTKGFNLLTSPFSKIGRGFGCSIQSTLNLTMHNLALVPCHRSGYDRMVTGYFDFFEDGTYDFHPGNIEMYISMQSAVATQIAPCSGCPINLLCSGTCIGSNMEETGDPYTAPPSVCRMEHIKTAAILKALEEINILDFYLKNADAKRKSQMLFVIENFREY